MRSRKAPVIFGIIIAAIAVSSWFVKAQQPAQIPKSSTYPERSAVCPKCDGAARTYERLRQQYEALVTLFNGGAGAQTLDPDASAKFTALQRQLSDAETSLSQCNLGCVINKSNPGGVHIVTRCQKCEALARDYEDAANRFSITLLTNLGKSGEEKVTAERAVAAAEAKLVAARKALEACEKEECKKPLGVGYPMVGAIAGGAAVLTGVAIGSGGGSNPPTATATAPAPTAPTPGTSSTTSTSTSSSSTTTTVPGITPASNFNGVYIGGGSVGTNECAFGATATVQGTMNVDSDGRGVWTKIHTSAGGVMFVFQIMLRVTGPNTAEWTSTTSRFIGLFGYQVTDTGSITGSVMTIRQNFVRDGTPSCMVTYNLTLNRQ